MKKTIITLAITCSFSASLLSQIGTTSLSEEIPESASITDIGTYDPQFNNSFVFMMAHGLTVFNQKTELFIIDSKTFAEKKKIDYPEYKGYTSFSVGNHQYMSDNSSKIAALKQTLAIFYSSKSDKNLALSVVKLKESFVAPEKPEYLFDIDNTYSLKFFANEKKDLCIFTYSIEYKKQKKSAFYYRVYTSDFKLLKLDSIVSEKGSPTWYYGMVFENGYAIGKQDGTNSALSITDLKTNKTNMVNLNHKNDITFVEKIKLIANNKFVVLSSYNYVMTTKEMKNGIRKTIMDLNGKIEEDIYFDHVPAGKAEEEKQSKFVSVALISETGVCYAMICQYYASIGSKYELMSISNVSTKWKKQLPMSQGVNNYKMLCSNGYLILGFLDYEGNTNKIDMNNYVYGKPMPSAPVTARQMYQSNITLLKINTNGVVQDQRILDTFYKSIMASDKQFICIYQGLNGQLASKCKFLRIELNDR